MVEDVLLVDLCIGNHVQSKNEGKISFYLMSYPSWFLRCFFFPGEIIHNFHGVIQQSIVQRGQHHLFSQQMTAGKRPKSQVLVDLSG